MNVILSEGLGTIIIYFTVGTGTFEFKCYEKSHSFFGKPSALYCTLYNISLTK